MDFPPVELIKYRLNQPAMTNLQSRLFTLHANSVLKIVGYNSNDGDTVATTGTSKRNTLCFTDGMGPCIGVAIGGEKLKHGVPSKGAKVRIFHVFPRNATSQHELRAYIQKLQQFGLTVKAAMHGGETTSPKSLAQASNLSALFSRMNVQVVFDETCEKREANKPLGVLIHANHAVQFVTELAQR